ncbi:MAG: MBOAT family protein, partial [Bacteroidales bacterium]|nr:MBOAT family protein [Bacteroidales bacterium]
AEANEKAWRTANNMVQQIGSPWTLQQVPEIASSCANILILFFLGMIIHWLPENFKRRYRISFAKLPLPVMAVVAVTIVFVIYQFVTADLQKFIYFQF